jgi:hypothetical protein
MNELIREKPSSIAEGGSIISGSQRKRQNPKYCEIDLDNEEDCLKLHYIVARGESLALQSTTKVSLKFKPLFKHPLPNSEARYQRERTLRRVMSMRLEKQAAGAVSLRDPWVLESLYLKGNLF